MQRKGSKGHQQREVKASWLVYLSWAVMISWVLFMLYYWQAGNLSVVTENETVQYVEKAFIRAEEMIENELKQVRVVVPINHVPAQSHPTTPTVAVQVSSDNSKQYDLHVIFSTDCKPYQDWQSLVLFHSATVVGQVGPITRIASGCDETKQKMLSELYKKLYPNYHVHFTPDFKKDDKTGHSYDFYNKPRGLQHWLKFANPPIPDGVVIALLDPDMIFVRPLTVTMRGQPNNLYGNYLKESDIVEKVEKGKPAAQMYGLGAPWTNDNHPKFKRGYICGEGSPCLIPNQLFGERHYAVGPPYIVEKSDMQLIADRWTDFVPRVYEGYPYLLAEMYAYSMAAAHENLPHLQFHHFMVSNTDAGEEGWPLVDVLDDSCVPPDEKGIYYPGRPLPTVVHYCQNFRVAYMEFAKRSANVNMFSCEAPLFEEPSPKFAFSDYSVYQRKREEMGKLQLKRNAYALCVIHRSINAAIIDYKRRMCDPSKEFVNYNKTYIVHRRDPSAPMH